MANPKRILVVDDDHGIREVVRTVLEVIGGHKVQTAPSGWEGVARARSSTLDAIILDAMMPGLDGLDTLTQLRNDEETTEVPVIFLSAKTEEADRRRFAMSGAAGVISKPFDPMKLCDQIAEILGWGA